MNIQQLYYFQALAATQHMTHAAAKLNITQPALSSNLSRLESELGLSLFDRSAGKLKLNANGKLFLKHVNVIIHEYQEAINEFEKAKEEQDSTLRLLISGTEFPKKIIKGFCRAYPDISIQQRLVPESQFNSELFSQTNYDFLLSSYPLALPNCQALVIYEEKFYLAVYKDHPLAERTSVDIQELKKESFIMLPEEQLFRQACESLCKAAGFKPKIAIECYPSQISDFLEHTMNVAFTIESALHRKEFSEDIRLIPFSTPGFTRKICLICRNDVRLSPSAKLFLRYCRSLDEQGQPESQ